MDFAVKSGLPEKQRSACLVVGVYEARQMASAAESLDTASGGYIGRIVRKGDMDGKVGQSLLLHHIPNIAAERVLIVGCGPRGETTARQYRQICQDAARLIDGSGAVSLDSSKILFVKRAASMRASVSISLKS